jgi:hypothetical protein
MQTRTEAQRLLATFLTALALFASMAGIASAGLVGNGWGGGDGRLYDINPATGAATNPRTLGTGWAIAFSPSGVLYGITQTYGTPTSNALCTVDPTTGTATVVAPNSPGIAVEGDMGFDPTSGLLYSVDGSGILYTVDTSTGVATLVGNVPGAQDLSAMAFDNSGNLFIIDTSSRLLLRVNKANAAVLASVALSPTPGGGVAGLTFDLTTGTAYYASGAGTTNNLYTLNTTSGALTLVGPLAGTVDGLGGLAFSGSCTPRPPDLRGWWRGENNTFDASGFGHNGILQGSPSTPYVPAEVGIGFNFDGIDDNVRVAHTTTLNFGTGDFSIDAWINPSDVSGIRPIVEKRTALNGTQPLGYLFYIHDGELRFLMTDPGGTSLYPSPVLIPTGTWSHVAVTVDRATPEVIFYLNGTRAVHPYLAARTGTVDNGAPLYVGANMITLSGLGGPSYFAGMLDEVEILARVLGAHEVNAIFAAGPFGKCPPPAPALSLLGLLFSLLLLGSAGVLASARRRAASQAEARPILHNHNTPIPVSRTASAINSCRSKPGTAV